MVNSSQDNINFNTFDASIGSCSGPAPVDFNNNNKHRKGNQTVTIQKVIPH